MTRLALLLAAAALVAAPAASTKSLIRAEVCGVSGCAVVTDEALLNEIPGGEDVTGLGAPAPYYRLQLVGGDPDGHRFGFTAYYVPSARAMSFGEDGVYRLHPIYGPRANGVMRRITKGIEPFAAPRITAAVVGGRRVAGAAAGSYASLFTAGERTPLGPSPDDWVSIDLRSQRPSPWTAGTSDLLFSKSRSLIEVGYEQQRIPADVADDIAAGRLLREEPGRGVPWGVLALAGVGLVAAFSLVRILPFKP